MTKEKTPLKWKFETEGAGSIRTPTADNITFDSDAKKYFRKTKKVFNP
jgi:hypothetical protein